MLFVQGARDPFGTSDEIEALLPSLQRATLHVVPDGDHSFKVRARAGLKPDQVLDAIMDTVVEWMGKSRT
jgi:predicted alpha/beta-hydrolase family hydrolase